MRTLYAQGSTVRNGDPRTRWRTFADAYTVRYGDGMPKDDKSVPSVWTRPRRQREQPALSQERIVAEAILLLDEEGLEALSMRNLGNRLGAGATSLYRHVANKDELVELAVDEVYGELEIPDPGGPSDWRKAAAASGQSLREMALRHTWVVSALGRAGLSYLGPNTLRMSDRMIAVFESAGFDLDEADQAMSTLISYVIGMVTSEASYLAVVARSGKSESELLRSVASITEQALQDHPRLQGGFAAKVDKAPQQIRDEKFTYGLDRVLDGLQTRLNQNAAP